MSEDQKQALVNAAAIAMGGVVLVLLFLSLMDGYGLYVCARLAFNKDPLPEPCTNGAISKFGLEILGTAAALYGATRMASSK